MLLLCLLAQVSQSYAGIGLDRIPSLTSDDVRLVVLGDSFASQSFNRIPAALLSELPEGQLVGMRSSLHSRFTKPIGVELLSDAHTIVNQQGTTSGCRELETDVGGEAWMRLPIGGLFDLRLNLNELNQSVFNVQCNRVDPAINEFSGISTEGVLARGVARMPTHGLIPAAVYCEPWSDDCVVEQFQAAPAGHFHTVFQTQSLFNAPLDPNSSDFGFQLAWNGGGTALQMTDVIVHGLQNGVPASGLYFTPLTDVSWSFSSYVNPEPCSQTGAKSFSDEEITQWLRETSVVPNRDLTFMVHLDTEPLSQLEYEQRLEELWSRVGQAVTNAGLGPRWSMVVVVPFRHKVYGSSFSEELMYFENLWSAVQSVAATRDNFAGVSLYHYFQGTRFDGTFESRRFLIENCQGTVTWNNVEINLAEAPASGRLLDDFDGHVRDQYSARFMANALLRALRGWSFVGDLNHDGMLDSADLPVLLAQWGATGVNEADLDVNGVVDNLDLDLLTQRLECAVPYSPPPPPLSPDLDGDGVVGITDLLLLLANWGSDDPFIDITRDGVVDWSDQLILLSNWTSSP